MAVQSIEIDVVQSQAIAMSKIDRQQAIRAELARRDAASGVPPRLRVYTIRPHYAGQGGPRPFQLARIVELFHTSKTDNVQFDLDLVRKSVDHALSKNEPVELLPSTDHWYKPNSPLADYCEINGRDCTLIILSSRADEVLHSLLIPCGRFVPVSCEHHQLVGFELTAIEDVLDVAKSEGSWYPPHMRERASRITQHVFHTEKLGAASMFRIPQHWQMYVLDDIVAAVHDAHLKGLKFKQVWPHRNVDL